MKYGNDRFGKFKHESLKYWIGPIILINLDLVILLMCISFFDGKIPAKANASRFTGGDCL